MCSEMCIRDRALVVGLRDYVKNNKFSGVVLGLSGGIDSALVAALGTDAFGSKFVQAIMLPSPYTGEESLKDARDSATLLNIKYSNLKISEAMKVVDEILGDFKGPNFTQVLLKKIFNQDLEVFY